MGCKHCFHNDGKPVKIIREETNEGILEIQIYGKICCWCGEYKEERHEFLHGKHLPPLREK